MARITELNSVPRSWAGSIYVGAGSLGPGAVVAGALGAGAVTAPALGAGAVLGVSASQPLRSKSCEAVIPTVIVTATTVTEVLLLVPQAGTINGINFTFKDALARHATGIVTFTVVNKGQAGAGTTQVLAASALNSTVTSTGLAIGAYTVRGTVLSAVGGALTVAQYDTLAVQITNGSSDLANQLTEGHVLVQIDVTV